MDYEMEELIPIVGELAEKYTSGESTSITYEKAEQLMEAVLYCIHELEGKSSYQEIQTENGDMLAENENGSILVTKEKLQAHKAYEEGMAYVKEKAENALALYNDITTEFNHYGNQCLYDTFVKGLPEFFKIYDILFNPQDTILTLDYPMLKDISQYSGIDKIYEFIKCIGMEQKFLSSFPEGYVSNILASVDRNWKYSIDNLCEMVLTYIIENVTACTSLAEFQSKKEVLLRNYYENDRELFDYLSKAVDNIFARLKIAKNKRFN